MSNPPRILITINGMGNPLAGETTEWAREVFPQGVLESSGEHRWLRLDDEKIFLVEVSYEDVNDALMQKFTGVRHVLPAITPDTAVRLLSEFVGDVCTNVLVKDALNAAQRRFVDAYSTAIRITIAESPETDPRRARVGVLCHSLGTLIAYEGLHSASDSPFIMRFPRVNLVMCAPMLSPIGTVQAFIAQRRYLTLRGSSKPALRQTIGRCMALYDRSDPFVLIQAAGYYRPSVSQSLVDSFVQFDSQPGVRFWEGHSMVDSYLRHNRQSIADFLFS